MHNRVGKDVESREITRADALVLVPLVAVIVFFALYPQLALQRSEGSAKAAVASAQAARRPYRHRRAGEKRLARKRSAKQRLAATGGDAMSARHLLATAT